MVFVWTMRHANDDEPFSFISLAALTANVTRFLFDKQKPPHDREPNENDGRNEDAERENHGGHVLNVKRAV